MKSYRDLQDLSRELLTLPQLHRIRRKAEDLIAEVEGYCKEQPYFSRTVSQELDKLVACREQLAQHIVEREQQEQR